MARGRKKRKNNKKNRVNDKDSLDYMSFPDFQVSSETKRAIFVVLVLTLGALSFIGLFGLGGAAGDYLARGLALALGFGKWIFPAALIIWALLLYRKKTSLFRGAHYLGLFFFLLSLQSLFHIFYPREDWSLIADAGRGGGYLGSFFASLFYSLLSFWGALLVLLALFIISILLIFNTTLSRIIGSQSLIAKLLLPFKWFFSGLMRIFAPGRREEEGEEEEFEEMEEEEEEDSHEEEEEAPLFSRKKMEEAPLDQKDPVDSSGSGSRPEKQESKVESNWEPSYINIDLPLNLLNDKSGKASSGDVKYNAMIIQRTLENFGIPVEMGDVEIGPTVAQYTLKPAEGVKLSKITNLGNDLALALAAHPIRIEAPIPGKALVGIEVPNKVKAVVTLREVLSSREFKSRKNNLMMALGKDVTGHSWMYDISRMPHLLIAGATNSGKSVCINSVIVSLLYQNNPDDLRFIMVDPKRVELPIYDGIPHLLTPVITDVNKTVNALKWCLNEMDRRFELLSKSKKRNITSYNNAPNTEKMPYIVFVVDELADLMVSAPREIEAGVIRLTQMARAVGIHLILATQRPSVDVITGLIKANVPARIAFSVASGIDSKTILDSQGAEKLLGQGDMLFVNPDMSKPKRIQGVFVSDAEVKRVVNYIKEHSSDFDYLEEVTDNQKVEGMTIKAFDQGQSSSDENGRDAYFEEAKRLVVDFEKGSASFLQRKLRVGYARAAGLLDELEEAGIVGPGNGSKPREVLINKESYQGMEGVSGVETHDREEAQAPENYFDIEEDEVEDETEEGSENRKESQSDEESDDLGFSKEVKEKEDDEEDNGVYFSR